MIVKRQTSDVKRQASGVRRQASIILLLAAVLRLGWPTLTEFKFSEARLEALALELTQKGRLPLVGVPSSAGFDHSPLSVYLYAPAFLLTANPIPATLYGGLVNVGAVALCWWLARRPSGGGRWAGVIAAGLLAVNPWMVAFSRKIWQVAFVPLLALALAGLAVSALIQGRRQHLAWMLAVYALLVQVHPSAISLAPAVALWLAVFWRQVRPAPLLAGAGLALLSGVPFLAHQLQSGWPALAAWRALPEATWDLSALHLAWEALTGRSIHALAGDAYPWLRVVPQLDRAFNLVGWLTVAAALGLAVRMVARWRAADAEERQAARVDLILLSWLAVPVLFNLRHSLELHLHFFALVVPAACLIVGRAAQAALRWRWAGRAQAVGAVGLGLLGLLALAQVAALVLMGRFVATHDTPGGFGLPLSRYLEVADRAVALAGEQKTAEVLVVGQGDSPVVDEVPAIFDVLLRGRVAYRFVDGRSAALFPAHRAVIVLAPQAGEAAEWYRPWPSSPAAAGYRLAVLDGTWPQEELTPITGPRLFQNGVELQGYRWEREGAGGRSPFWLLWQVLWSSPDDTHFFVHLLGQEGQKLGQQDSPGYPTAYRQKGDRVVSLFDITKGVAALPDPLWARVGLYTYPAVANVAVVDGAGNIVTDSVVIGLFGAEKRGP